MLDMIRLSSLFYVVLGKSNTLENINYRNLRWTAGIKMQVLHIELFQLYIPKYIFMIICKYLVPLI